MSTHLLNKVVEIFYLCPTNYVKTRFVESQNSDIQWTVQRWRHLTLSTLTLQPRRTRQSHKSFIEGDSGGIQIVPWEGSLRTPKEIRTLVVKVGEVFLSSVQKPSTLTTSTTQWVDSTHPRIPYPERLISTLKVRLTNKNQGKGWWRSTVPLKNWETLNPFV